MAKKTQQKTIKKVPTKQKEAVRTRISQSEIPRHSLRDALTIAQALTDNFAGHPTAPHQVAVALTISPTSSVWRTLTGASAAYGLTKGAYASDRIELAENGRRATAPMEDGDDIKA